MLIFTPIFWKAPSLIFLESEADTTCNSIHFLNHNMYNGSPWHQTAELEVLETLCTSYEWSKHLTKIRMRSQTTTCMKLI